MEFGVRMTVKGFLICYLFYDSYKAAWALLPFAIFDFRNLRRHKLAKQQRELSVEFRSMAESVAASLNAGYSLEHAFENAKNDLALLYEEDAMICKEVERIIAGIHMNIPVEELLKDFGNRSGMEDIQNFANVVAAAKKSGGNLIQIIEKTVNCITDKIAVEEEIATMISAKKLEEQIMKGMPYAIIFYLRVSNGDFMDVLYHNVFGIFCMTVFLVITYLAELWADHIMEIQV